MGYCCNSRAVRTSEGISFPIIWAIAGFPVGLSVMERRMFLSRVEVAWTRKYSVKLRSAPPYLAMSRQNGRSVTSCIGASARIGVGEAGLISNFSPCSNGVVCLHVCIFRDSPTRSYQYQLDAEACLASSVGCHFREGLEW